MNIQLHGADSATINNMLRRAVRMVEADLYVPESFVFTDDTYDTANLCHIGQISDYLRITKTSGGMDVTIIKPVIIFADAVYNEVIGTMSTIQEVENLLGKLVLVCDNCRQDKGKVRVKVKVRDALKSKTAY